MQEHHLIGDFFILMFFVIFHRKVPHTDAVISTAYCDHTFLVGLESDAGDAFIVPEDFVQSPFFDVSEVPDLEVTVVRAGGQQSWLARTPGDDVHVLGVRILDGDLSLVLLPRSGIADLHAFVHRT